MQVNGYKRRLLQKLKKDTELNEFFSRNLELANNYDFI
nr:MAG TPA: hypothetical protein [Bacteriophage sp.]